MSDRVRGWWDEAVVPRLLLVRHLPLMGPGVLTALILANIALGLVPVAFIVATAVLVGRVPAAVVAGAGSAAWRDLVVAFLATAGLFVAQQMLSPVQGALGEWGARRVDGAMRQQVMRIALSSTSVAPMEDQQVLDAFRETIRRIETNAESPGAACAGTLALLARYTSLAGFLGVLGVVASWPAAVVLLAAVLIFRQGQRGGMRRYSRIWTELTPLLREGDYLHDVGITDVAAKEIRVYGLAGWLSERYRRNYLSWLPALWRARRRAFLYPYLAITAFGLLAAVLAFLLVTQQALDGRVGLTGLALALQATVAAVLLGGNYPEADMQTTFGTLSLVGMRRFADLVGAADRPVPPGSATGCAGRPREEVRLEKVTFRYPGSGKTVLDGLDLRLRAGQATAIVGMNGAGKSTIVKLLTRLYEPDGGRITVDGTDVRDFEVADWRRQTSVIFQDFVRYELSVADNIAVGAIGAPRSATAIREAAAAAGILAAIERLPQGFDTPLARAYTGGTDLSGGQWQRIAIARSAYAVMNGARLLIMDEPTSALDVRAEAAFFDEFADVTRGVTSVLISHRFSSVRRADHIVVIDDGRVVEEGSHDDLMTLDGRYARMFSLQAERFEADL